MNDYYIFYFASSGTTLRSKGDRLFPFQLTYSDEQVGFYPRLGGEYLEYESFSRRLIVSFLQLQFQKVIILVRTLILCINRLTEDSVALLDSLRISLMHR